MPASSLAKVATLHRALGGSTQVQERLDAGTLTREDAARIAVLAEHAERSHPPGSLDHDYVREAVEELRHWLAQARKAVRVPSQG